MKVTLKQSPYGWIWISIECSQVCTHIHTSCVFDPYQELYIWLRQIRDLQLPATMIIDEEGRGVELVAEQSSDDLIQFRIEPWMCGNDTTTRLDTQVERHELLKAFHDGALLNPYMKMILYNAKILVETRNSASLHKNSYFKSATPMMELLNLSSMSIAHQIGRILII